VSGLLAALAVFFATLLYQLKPSDVGVLAIPLVTLVLITVSSAIPAIIRGIRIDPVEMLRAESSRR
jgi:ABC-type lipoprotein release transport system permease subunit